MFSTGALVGDLGAKLHMPPRRAPTRARWGDKVDVLV